MSPPRSVSRASLVVIGRDEDFKTLLTAAFRAVFPRGEILPADTVSTAMQTKPHSEVEIVALLDPPESVMAEVTGAMDAFQLPRWGVVACTRSAAASSSGKTVLVLEEWNARTLAVVLREVANLQGLRRENARYRGEFLSIGTRVVHDLRSPLGGILTTAEVLKEILQDEMPTQVPLVEPLIESTDGLTKLIRRLSAIAKATAGENPKIRLNMGTPFWAAFQGLEREALAAGATIKHPATWPEVEGDPAWIELMWQALLSNSIAHAPRPPRVEAGWNVFGDENRFWVVDGGKIPPEKRGALFTPFHRLHQPNAPRGLGLPIVQRLAELQGGHCGYELLPDRGSCFFFTLPMVKGAVVGG